MDLYADIMIYAVAAIIGLSVGSFLNVLIYRVPEKLSIVSPPSHCPSCGKRLKWYDNIPVVSYLVLRGRCRQCGERISIQYLMVEATSAFLTVAAVYRFGAGTAAAAVFFLLTLLTVSAIDLRLKIIPNRIIIPAMIVSAVASIIFFPLGREFLPLIGRANLPEAAIGFILGGGLLFLIALVWSGGMGGGDIKLGAFMGLFLGRYVLMALFFGFLLGSLAGLVSIALLHKGRKDMLPFGPFLALGSLLTLFFGVAILNWYLSVSGMG